MSFYRRYGSIRVAYASLIVRYVRIRVEESAMRFFRRNARYRKDQHLLDEFYSNLGVVVV
jgi:hypothetical protein